MFRKSHDQLCHAYLNQETLKGQDYSRPTPEKPIRLQLSFTTRAKGGGGDAGGGGGYGAVLVKPRRTICCS